MVCIVHCAGLYKMSKVAQLSVVKVKSFSRIESNRTMGFESNAYHLITKTLVFHDRPVYFLLLSTSEQKKESGDRHLNTVCALYLLFSCDLILSTFIALDVIVDLL